MVEPVKFKYSVVIKDSKGKQYNITNLIEDLSWEEREKELAARLSFSAKNDRTSKGRVSSLAKPGCWVALLYSYNGGKKKEAMRGRIIEWNPSAKSSDEALTVKAYDILFDLQSSNDNVYHSSGKKTKTILKALFKKWNIPLGKYTGPNVKHGKVKYHNKSIGSIVIDVLSEAKKKGGKEGFLRAVKNKVQVLKYGSNKNVYRFSQAQNLTQVSHKISTASMVTRVKVIGQQKDKKRTPVYATVNGKTEFGIRQKMYSRSKDESLKKAKKAAKQILKEEGKPKTEISFKTLDLPFLRKGDKIYLEMSTGKGYYHVISVQHDCDEGSMTLDVKKAGSDSSSGKKKSKSKSKNYKVGDIVTFKGGHRYYTSSTGSKGYLVKGTGKAKITKINKKGKHPYHLITRNWGKSHVWGWVNKGTFS